MTQLVVQKLPKEIATKQFEKYVEEQKKKRNREAAFKNWCHTLQRGDRLPRGRYFVGKKPGPEIIVVDEYWMYGAGNVSELSNLSEEDAKVLGKAIINNAKTVIATSNK